MIALKNAIEKTVINAELAILKAIAYFDIFHYPLTEKEIRNFLDCPLNEEEFQFAMRNLLAAGRLFKLGEFYSLSDDSEKAHERVVGNTRAMRLLSKAINIGAFLHKFPYVRSVAVSGSLSKGYADEQADIDFFIITKGNRLWISRTLLHLFKKLTFLTRNQDLYCMNYFIDEESLEIPEKNIYAATEIVTLFPVSGELTSRAFFSKNAWVAQWLPQSQPDDRSELFDKNPLLKRLIEWSLNNHLGDRFDNFLYGWTTRRWAKKEKEGQKNSKGKVMNLLTGKHFAKSNPEDFQQRIVTLYEAKVRALDRMVND